jgi:hypothetical protein
MQISPDSGLIILEGDAPALGPGVSRSAFLASEFGERAKTIVDGELHHSYSLAPVEAHETQFLITVYFEGERLTRIEWMDGDTRYGSTSANWSEEKERQRDLCNREWLERWGIAVGEHAWGTVRAGYDPPSEESFVAVRYAGGT